SAALPDRGWRGVYELSAGDFLANYAAAKGDRRQLGEWTAEAAKRFGVPSLAIAHTLLAMALVLTFGNITGRRGAAGSFAVIAIPAVHIGFLVALESLLRINGLFVLLLAVFALAEVGVSVWLISRLNWSPKPKRLFDARAASVANDAYATPLA
ncbi:MAG: permease, partial [Methylocystis sp.]